MSSPGESYKEKMSTYLESNKLPPTNWELRDYHRTVEAEIMSKAPDQPKSVQKEINQQFKEVKSQHKLMREESLIESAIGRKNYVDNRS